MQPEGRTVMSCTRFVISSPIGAGMSLSYSPCRLRVLRPFSAAAQVFLVERQELLPAYGLLAHDAFTSPSKPRPSS